MKYFKTIKLKDSRDCVIRNGEYGDGPAALENFILTHRQTDFLMSLPEECTMTSEQEGEYLQEKADSENEAEILALVDGKVAGTAGFESVGKNTKVNHRAEFGISVDREYWNLGIGTTLLKACVECAKKAGYTQLELNVAADNERAIALYKKAGFREFGRNPKGFKARESGYTELVYMYLEV